MPGEAIAYEQAVERLARLASGILARTEKAGQHVKVSLQDAVGRVCIEDVYARQHLPAFDNSAMDGFAVTSSATVHASRQHPLRLRVLGSIAAGDMPPVYDVHDQDRQCHSSCYRINTGAPFPLPTSGSSAGSTSLSRYDACARIEVVQQVSEDIIEIYEPVRANQHRRMAGEDFHSGIPVVQQGEVIRPGHIAALAANGVADVKVASQHRIAVLTTGKELRQAKRSDGDHLKGELPDGRIYNSNGPYVESVLRGWGFGNLAWIGSVGDDANEFQRKLLQDIRGRYDILVTTGGVSKGQHDYIEGALREVGADILFHGVRMRPGHPVLAASLTAESGRDLAIFSLPGNPVAAAACVRFLVLPFLRILTHRPDDGLSFYARLDIVPPRKHRQEPASCLSGAPPRPLLEDSGQTGSPIGFRTFLLAQRSKPTEGSAETRVRLLERGSGMVRPLAQADCWVVLSEGQQPSDGGVVDCRAL